ncbi:hypothetical protein V1517DRAFT_256324 [Lipomyces orientalis]|uniref:Uncharacterized protein n=1 Tax=Lipomyces orientalis TaxID=1233043 RepID=A0ACC3TT22_9ASCO
MAAAPRCESALCRAVVRLQLNHPFSSRRLHEVRRRWSTIGVAQQRYHAVRSVAPSAGRQRRCISERKSVRRYNTDAGNPDSVREDNNPVASVNFTIPLAGYVDLSPRRRLIEVTGLDAFKFLHGLITNEPPSGHDGIYATFLNVRGRIMYDVFIYPALHNKKWASQNRIDNPETATYLIEHDIGVTDQLYKYLTFRKLRDKVALRKLTDWKVWFAWEDDPQNLLMRRIMHKPIEYDSKLSLRKTPQFIGANDNRAPGFGVRMVLSNDAASPLWPLRVYEEGRIESFVQADITTYNVRRVMYGIPEGTQDFLPGDMLPMESCVDMMGGINFDKGCYVGQELTTRAKRVGITKKRLVPYTLYDLASDEIPGEVEYNSEFALPDGVTLPYKSPIVEANAQPKINSRGEVMRSVGRLISRTANIGLANVKLDWVDKGEEAEPCRVISSDGSGALSLNDTTPVDDKRGIGIKFFRPFWWHDADRVFVPPTKEEAGTEAGIGSSAGNGL